MQSVHDVAIELRSAIPNFGKADPIFAISDFQTGEVFFNGEMPEGAGTVSQNETQIRVPRKSQFDLACKRGQFVRSHRVWRCLICDERSAEFDKYEFSHIPILPCQLAMRGSCYNPAHGYSFRRYRHHGYGSAHCHCQFVARRPHASIGTQDDLLSPAPSARSGRLAVVRAGCCFDWVGVLVAFIWRADCVSIFSAFTHAVSYAHHYDCPDHYVNAHDYTDSNNYRYSQCD